MQQTVSQAVSQISHTYTQHHKSKILILYNNNHDNDSGTQTIVTLKYFTILYNKHMYTSSYLKHETPCMLNINYAVYGYVYRYVYYQYYSTAQLPAYL